MKYSFIILLISGTIAIHASENESTATKLTILKDESMTNEVVLELFCDEIFNLADEDNRPSEKLISCKAFLHYSLSELKDHLMLQQSIADYYKDHKGHVACCLFNIYAKLYLEKVKNEYTQDLKDQSVDVPSLLKDKLPMLQKIAHHKNFEEKSKHSINEYINREKAAELHSKYVNLYMMVADSKIEPCNILFKNKK